jgi:hypothetical protein
MEQRSLVSLSLQQQQGVFHVPRAHIGAQLQLKCPAARECLSQPTYRGRHFMAARYQHMEPRLPDKENSDTTQLWKAKQDLGLLVLVCHTPFGTSADIQTVFICGNFSNNFKCININYKKWEFGEVKKKSQISPILPLNPTEKNFLCLKAKIVWKQADRHTLKGKPTIRGQGYFT